MIKEILFEQKRKLGLIILSLLLITVFGLVCLFSRMLLTHIQEKEVTDALSTLDYNTTASDDALEQLQSYLSYSFLGDEVKGQIYEKMALFSYFSNNKEAYNTNTGCAIYYFQNSGNDEKVVALYCNYIGRLYENASYETALSLLDTLSSQYDIDSFSNINVCISYYLCYADVEEQLDHLDSASSFLEKAIELLTIHTDIDNHALLSAKYDMLLARLDLLQGNTDEASSILSRYDETNTFSLPEGNLYVTCDFLLPYYELSAKLLLSQGDDDHAGSYIDSYLDICDSCSFYLMKLRMLQYVLDHSKNMNSEFYNAYAAQESTFVRSNLSYLSEQYCASLMDNIYLSIEKVDFNETKTHASHRMYLFLFLLIYPLILIGAGTYFIFLYLHTDGLTRLYVRTSYESKRHILEKRKTTYFLLILDIDDFKKVNDTYGHKRGDEVLFQISRLIKNACDNHCIAYRYGGEEICLIHITTNETVALSLAESIREQIESFSWTDQMRITISGGLAKAEYGKNAFQKADQNLYFSKANGKNQITYKTTT